MRCMGLDYDRYVLCLIAMANGIYKNIISQIRNTQYNMDFDYAYNRPLATDGCDGDGSLCGFHCLCSSAEFEGVNTTSLQPTYPGEAASKSFPESTEMETNIL